MNNLKNHQMLINNIQSLQTWMKELASKYQVDALYLPSFDIFFNEYVPLDDCLRYFVSGFTGSVSEMLALPNARPRLYVDGRYYEQADREVCEYAVEIVKVPYGTSLKQALLHDLQNLGIKKMAILADRTPDLLANELSQKTSLHLVQSADLVAQLKGVKGHDPEVQLQWVDHLPSVEEKLARLLNNNDKQAWLLTAPESVAWITNARGHQFPFQATFAARAFVSNRGITVFHRPSVKPPLKSHPLIRWQQCHLDEVPQLLAQAWQHEKCTSLQVHRSTLSRRDAAAVETLIKQPLIDGSFHITTLMANKVSLELNAFDRSFEKSDKAIWQSLEWMHQKCQLKVTPTELEWSDQVWQFYREQGASDLSFKTIAGVGAHSSIIHYSTPSAQTHYVPGDLALLDSGGHFGDGICTDTTRTIMPAGQAKQSLRLQYTLVLKGLLQALNAVFPVNTPGHYIDSLARSGMRRHGFDYAHGTGHGVGVAVHEPGVSFTPQSLIPIVENRVGSLEPGIYLPGIGGVRLENIVIVQKHPTLPGMLCFKNLVWIGFQMQLVDLQLLNLEERAWFNSYQEECGKRQRLLTF
jgi:Xaa-Pro aminopeptidase